MGFKCARWTLPNLLPIFFVMWVIGTIWSIYVFLHLLFILQIWCPRPESQPHTFDQDMFNDGVVQGIISQILTLMVLVCFLLAIFTDPGSVPNNSVWVPDAKGRRGSSTNGGDEDQPSQIIQREAKRSGLPRFCKWCSCYKPDRCHHCRICRSCIPRMDHHCPWIANCVGFRNHKFFFLLVVYALSTVVYMFVTMLKTLDRVLTEETAFPRRFGVVFGMTMMVLMGSLLFMFFLFHAWLTATATTTIEFCEKAYKVSGSNGASIYDQGLLKNIQAVLGDNPLFWLLPCGGPEGDGTVFPTRSDQTPGQASGTAAKGEGGEKVKESPPEASPEAKLLPGDA
eukprot:TRINITY_DN55944_c0_g1_i1.p1 TRINITY_DN55944_c0_g1~~TRINITY_DN55944_c0_g1_i1.p1  ORF type:complete len:340 (-),score=63.26 TRINITY_DN55944_c0_g1_i1:54-1073(-)